MGSGDQSGYLECKDVQYVAMCDVREEVRQKSKAKIDRHYGNKDCRTYNDFRELLARPDIEVVTSRHRTTGMPSSRSKRAATARTCSARNRKRSRCGKAR